AWVPMNRWTTAAPILGLALLAAALLWAPAAWLTILCAIALVGCVLAAVHHADVIAHRVGEPFGTLVLALAVTVIEVALIVSMMLAGGAYKAMLTSETISSTLTITSND